ncbi:hypothetical protein AQUCO_00200649v1 [Aquilegia coerulea]|uniref:Cytochrome c oxidase copper chaperone n=1 Tax=Aquilegia coerulea TaxID=218851 RepID=A0A2G5F492_AQUCA|nr:hypothetical protein AQUCO_00200649v1 [Aquilegia coerulea]
MGGLSEVTMSASNSNLSTNLPNQEPLIESGSELKPKKKICCACPNTKRLRDECIVEHGETACSKWINTHLECLRTEGFNV